jgi:hypothetical protein
MENRRAIYAVEQQMVEEVVLRVEPAPIGDGSVVPNMCRNWRRSSISLAELGANERSGPGGHARGGASHHRHR